MMKLSGLLFAIWPAVSAAAVVPSSVPSVQGPITGGNRGYPFGSYFGNIASVGYIEQEFFVSGTATRYQPVGNLTIDGQWTLQTTTTDSYKTRILVRRPINPAKFSGVAILEWINVSFGYDITFGGDAPGLYEDGTIYVLVSAQKIGVSGTGSSPQGLQQWDPARYGSLNIPDDGLSYDIFTQVARLIKSPAGQLQVLGGLRPNVVAGVGGSQSGTRLRAYSNGVQPLVNVLDVVMPMLTANNAAGFAADTSSELTTATKIRTDLSTPIWAVDSEFEAIIPYLQGTLQPDSNTFRYWQVAGASHVNGPILKTILQVTNRDGVPPPEAVDPTASQVNWLPVVDAAYRYLPAWINNQTPPPSKPLIQANLTGQIPALVRGADGNVIGGIRQPELTVPIAVYVGMASPTSLDGLTTPYNSTQLQQLYPNHTNYVAKVTAAALQAQRDGIILDYQVNLEISNAQAASVPS